MEQRHSSGLGFYLFMIAIAIVAFIWIRKDWNESTERPWQQFVDEIEQDNVERAEIRPNREVPTGQVKLYFKNASPPHSWSVEDVAEAKRYLLEKEITVVMMDVPTEDTFFTIVLPILVGMLIVILVVMSMFTRSMNAMGGGDGGGHRMANFGKSRAKVTRDGHGINFKKVAGLAEEKERSRPAILPRPLLSIPQRLPPAAREPGWV